MQYYALMKFVFKKHILLFLLPLFFMSSIVHKIDADQSYSKLWDYAVKSQKEGKPKTTLKAANILIKKSRKEENEAELLKALILLKQLKEDHYEKELILEFEEIISSVKSPLKNILESILADIYWDYYRSIGHTLSSENKEKDKKNNLKNWGEKDFIDKVNELLLSSIKEPDSLRQADPDLFKESLILPGEEKYKYPSIYEFLVYKAIDFWTDEDKISYAENEPFTIDSSLFFESSTQYLKLKWNHQEGFIKNAFKQFQIIEKLYENYPDLQADAMLKRVLLAFSKSTNENKIEILSSTLSEMSEKYMKTKIYPEIMFHLADCYYEEGINWNPGDLKDHRWSIRKSLEICEKVLSEHNYSPGAVFCENLKNKILQPEFEFIMETDEIPDRPMKALIKYKNVENVFFSVLNFTPDKPDLNEYVYSEIPRQIMYYGLVKRWEQSLPKKNDYRTHSVEIKVPALPPGKYIIAASKHPEFSILDADKNHLGHLSINISNYFLYEDSEATYVLHRDTGHPVEGVQVDMSSYFVINTSLSRNNKIQRKWETIKKSTVTSSDGKVENPKGYEWIKLKKGADSFYKRGYLNYSLTRKPFEKTFFFTDRSIYRPGQTVYFKGLQVRFDQYSKPFIVPGKKITVSIKKGYWYPDKNVLDDISFETNEYGSFSGSFDIPDSVKNNIFISTENDSIEINVAEYKRHSFKVEINEIKESVSTNSTVKIKGIAQSFAGADLTDAIVKYSYCDNSLIKEGDGALKLEKAGLFEFSFNIIQKNKTSVFNNEKCTVSVYVTDISGETHSAKTSFTVSNTITTILDSDLKDIQELNSFKSVQINSKTLNGKDSVIKGSVRIYKLKDADNLLKRKYWGNPDTFIFSKKEFAHNFSHDTYLEEEKEIEKTLIERKIDTSKSSNLIIGDKSKWDDGYYRIEIDARDTKNNKASYSKDFFLIRGEDGDFGLNIYLKSFQLTESALPGQDVKILLASGDNDSHVILKILNSNGIKQELHIKLNKSKKIISIPVTENDSGGLTYTVFMFKHNRPFWFNGRIDVPWIEKDIDVSFINFKNIIESGSEETWTLKIKYNNGKDSPAEMLGAMYDASLDKIEPHSWSASFWPFFDSYSGDSPDIRLSSGSIPFKTIDDKEARCNPYINYLSYTKDEGFCKPSEKTIQYQRIYLGKDSIGSEEKSLKYRSKTVIDFEDVMLEGQIKKPGGSDLRAYERNSFVGTQNSIEKTLSSGESTQPFVQIRKDMKETAFFFPQMVFDENNEISFSFKAPDSLSKWKFMGFVHSKDLKFSNFIAETVTQKKLMISPNLPRFLRSGDEVIFNTKITNMTESELKGSVKLELFDTATLSPINYLTDNKNIAAFAVPAKGNSNISWKLKVNSEYSSITWRIVAISNNVGDGAEGKIDVLPQKILVTESIPFITNPAESEEIRFEKFIRDFHKTGIDHQDFLLELTTDPIWSAILSMPYLIEFPHECSEQVFNRFYASVLTAHLFENDPIKTKFKHLNIDQQNKLKIFFDNEFLQKTEESALKILNDRQSYSGGFSWFDGLHDNRFVSQYIAAGFGKLKNILKNETQIGWSIITAIP